MKHLLRIELKRRLTSAGYLGGILVMLLYDFREIAGTKYGFEASISGFLFQTLPLICVCIAVNTALVIGQEMDHRTINNKLFCGYGKQDFYVVEVLAVTGLTILLLYAGSGTVHILIQPERTTLFSENGEEHDNPLYVEGPQKTLLQAHLSCSPYAQAYYMPYAMYEKGEDKRNSSLVFVEFPYHLEFVIFGLMEAALLFYAGTWCLRGKNLA